MKIVAKNLTKRFESEWIVRDFSYTFEPGSQTAITGPNGSGKSTLLKMIAGIMLPNKGALVYTEDNGNLIPEDEYFRYFSFCSPAQQLIEEYTLEEFLNFHFKFKSPIGGENVNSVIEKLKFSADKKKLIRNFSSGMKQRLKLGVALFTKSEVIYLDEPTTNMDDQTVQWYAENVLNLSAGRSLIISSNQKNEYNFCTDVISMLDFKPS